MRKNPHDRILRGEPKEQYLNIVPKSFPIENMILWKGCTPFLYIFNTKPIIWIDFKCKIKSWSASEHSHKWLYNRKCTTF